MRRRVWLTVGVLAAVGVVGSFAYVTGKPTPTIREGMTEDEVGRVLGRVDV